MTIALWRRLLAEFAGTALLVTAVVGSGIMATDLSPDDVGLQLLQNSIATAFALGVLILMFGPVSGAHFNPVVSAADWLLGRRSGTGLSPRELAGYVAAQVTGAVAGSVLANLMFALSAVTFSGRQRGGGNLWLGEVVATAGLVLLIFALARSGRAVVRRPPWAPTSGRPTGLPRPPRSPTRRSRSAARSPTPSPASLPVPCRASWWHRSSVSPSVSACWRPSTPTPVPPPTRWSCRPTTRRP